MKLNYNEKELHQLLQDFHDLTKLTLTLYDPEGEWIFSYPTKENYFCNCIKTPRKELPSVKLPTVLPLKQQRLPVNVSFTNVMPV